MISIDKIISYEQGDLTDMECIELFSELIGDGTAWSLLGHYGRTAQDLINSGLIDSDGNIDFDLVEERLS